MLVPIGPLVLYLTIAACGYLTFGNQVPSNVINGYPNTPLLSVARAVLGVVMLCNVPPSTSHPSLARTSHPSLARTSHPSLACTPHLHAPRIPAAPLTCPTPHLFFSSPAAPLTPPGAAQYLPLARLDPLAHGSLLARP